MSLQIRKDIIRLIKSKYIKNIAIVMHNNPDGDCIGSAVALEEALKRNGKKVDIIMQTKIAKKFAPIIGQHRVDKFIIPYEEKRYDLTFVLDVADFNRTYYDIKYKSNKIIIIDHHLNENIPKVDYYLNENDASTGITVYKLIKQLSPITDTIATAIYLTIRDDTSNFKNSNTTSQTMSFASELLLYNANIQVVNSIYDYKTPAYIKLLSIVLKNIKIDSKNKIAHLIISKSDIIESKSNAKEAGLIIDLLKTIEGIDIALVFIETNNSVTIKARSKSFNVNNIIMEFGGGGHECASACVLPSDDIYMTRDRVIARFIEEINK